MNTKIESLKARIKHLRDEGDGNKGYIADTTEAKKGAEIKYNEWKQKRVDEEKEEETLKKNVEDAKKKRDEAKKKHEEADKLAVAALKKYDDTHKVAIDGLRKKLLDTTGEAAKAAVTKAEADLNVQAKEEEIQKLDGIYREKVEICRAAMYDKFKAAEEKAMKDRTDALEKIEAHIDKKKAAAKAHGTTGGRCEKPLSNGDHIRRGKCAADTDCCGAATGRPEGAAGPLVTIEVCQARDAPTWGYVAPRAAMALTDPTPEPWPFKCIGGAKELAGTAAALLASAYMMA